MQSSLPSQYKKLKKIGEGANASVYAAYDTQKNIPEENENLNSKGKSNEG